MRMNIGLIGAGTIAQKAYLQLLKGFPELILTTIVEPDEKITNDLSNKFSFSYIGPDLEAALKHVDAVIICVPNFLHYPIA